MQIEAPSGISGMRRALLDAVEAGKNVQLNIDNAENPGYTETNGGVSSSGDKLHGTFGEGVRESSEGNDRSVSGGRPLGRGDLHDFRERRSVTVSSGGVVTTGILSSEDSAVFSDSLQAARAADERNGWAVTPKTAAELDGHEMILAENGSAGAAVAEDGDIQAVFRNTKTGVKGSMEAIIPRALELGGNKLDCYGEGLVRVYENYGFIPVARVEFSEEAANPGWDASKGTPYVYFMMHNGDSAETVAANIGKYGHMTREQLDSLPTYGKDGYDQATAYRDSLLSDRSSAPQQEQTDAPGTAPEVSQPVTRQRANPAEDTTGTGRTSRPVGRKTDRSRVIENTLKNSPVFGGVFQDVRDEMLEQNKNAARYNVSHEVDSLAEAADRIQADPKGEAEYLLTDNDGHVWSAPDIDTAMGLIASNQLDGDAARAVAVVISFLTASAIRV